MKPYPLTLHIFRRDLRLHDNTALIEALRQSDAVIPCFIFDPKQIDKNSFKSLRAIQFMCQSLEDLQQQLERRGARLYFFAGEPDKVIANLLTTLPIAAVTLNQDYTPYSRKRDHQIETLCQQHGIDYHAYPDVLLNEPSRVLKADGEPYTVYTPYMKKSKTYAVAAPQDNRYKNYYNKRIKQENNTLFANLQQQYTSTLITPGGRTAGIQLLKKAIHLTQYQQQRDFPELDATSHLSPHNKFGTLSVREVYSRLREYLGAQSILINQLYWRDFFTQIAYHFPKVFGHAFHAKYDTIEWTNNKADFKRWCEGQTGFPIVDAGMRELNETGYMHNRLRMITASFLTKDLHIDWRWGEKYYAQQLIDYDPAVNNGSWQWAASTGCDAQPYFRIFNPWLQQKRFDAECRYIKQWVPELGELEPQSIHKWADAHETRAQHYPAPMLEHKIMAAHAKSLYKQDSQ